MGVWVLFVGFLELEKNAEYLYKKNIIWFTYT